MKSLHIKIFILSIILLVSGFTFLQCNSSDKTEKKEVKAPEVYFPLKDGLKWTYINEAPREETILKSVQCSKANGEYILDNFPFFGNLNNSDTKTIIGNDDSGNVSVKNSSGVISILVPGEHKISGSYTWKYNDLLNAYLTSTLTKIKAETVEYNCIYIIFTDGFTFSYEMWLAKGIGIVKWGANRTNPPSPHLTYFVLKEFSE